ncbi:MAG TPA: flavodoxin domain-containing protein [Candidatus Elarobacter sp.]|nr:flavodoxin domain-containing protein [Candidatus Elarobacter sp.]
MRVLIAYASKMGGTAGIAETIGDALFERGIVADVVPVDVAGPPATFDAVLVGSGLYMSRWRRSARRFVRRNAAALQQRPVWFFSSGPLDATATEKEIPPVAQVRTLMTKIGARGHATFGGRLSPDATGFPARAMAKEHAGDWRDPKAVRAWADLIADQLQAVSVPVVG